VPERDAVKRSFTERELDIMEVLWSRGPSTVTEVRDALEDDLAYTTVQSMLRVLEQKGFAGHVEEGRTFRFHALVERDEAGGNALSRLLERLFGGNSERLLNTLVSERDMSPEELRRLRKLLDDRLKER
jgi:predicted transcriptional regulator